MLDKNLETKLNEQLTIEANASQTYLAMASWLDSQGLPQTAKFFFEQSAEEREHMLKILHYINERNGFAVVKATVEPKKNYDSVDKLISEFVSHEVDVTQKISELVEMSLNSKDFITYEFLQWFLSEQREEEALAHDLLDRYQLIKGSELEKFYLEQYISEVRKSK